MEGAAAPGMPRLDSPTCPHCHHTFASYGGRRVHERARHPESFHGAEAARLSSRPKARWDPEEVNLMVAFERAHLGESNMNELVRTQLLPHRTLEAIKGKRKQASYRALLLGEPSLTAGRGADPGRLLTPRQPLSPPTAVTLAERERETSVVELPQTQEDPSQAIRLELEALSTILGIEVPRDTSDVQTRLDDWSPPSPSVSPGPSLRNQRVPKDARGRRRMEYARFQENWKRDRGRATRRVVAGHSWLAKEGPKPEGTSDFWQSLFARPSPPPIQGDIVPVRDSVEGDIWKPISEEDVIAALKATHARTARGLDGRSKADVEALGVVKLRWLYNAALWFGRLPPSLTQGRSVLIPKVDEPTSPSDFRPLTITPILTRVLHRVLAKRVSTHAPLPQSQRGFKREEGCAANIMLVRQAISQAKAAPKSLYMAFLDFKKAFDSVGHPAIRKACLRWGLGEKFSNYVGNTLDQAVTDFEGAKVPITRGVMQGDPLSPLLFNLTLDWALSAAPDVVGVELGGTHYRYLAFADDVVLLSSSPVGLRKSVEAVVSQAKLLGLEVGHSKCATLGIAADCKRKTWYSSNQQIHIAGQPIRALAPGKFYRYLGVQVGSSHWAEGPSHLLARLVNGLRRLQKCPAKPQQKMWMLVNVLLPQLQYPLLHSEAKKSTLKKVDVETRRFARTALHLPADSPKGYFHAGVTDGGLGITSFETRIPRLRHDLLARLTVAGDQSVRSVARQQCSSSSGSSSSARRSEERDHWRTNLYKSHDGKGLEGCTQTPVSSSWVGDGTALMRGGAYVQAVKLRGSLMPTLVRSARGRKRDTVSCDLCYGHRPETLGHILQQCPAVAGARLARHNDLLEKYISSLQKAGYQTRRELAIPTIAGVRYPDIVCWRGNQSHVIDVQVVADATAGSLDDAHARKVAYYNTPCINAFVQAFTGNPPIFSSFTLSWRGVLALPSMNTWASLGLPKSVLKLMVVLGLEGGVRIHQCHKKTSGARVRRA